MIGIAYTFPDLDAIVRVNMIATSTNQSITCIKARVVNSATVYQAGVAWTLATITGASLFAGTILSILGYSNIATQVSFRALLFLGFMQSQAMAGLTAVEFTPMIQNWTQNFQWTMSIVRANFLNTITTWFQRATGGTASDLVSEAGDISIGLLKRSTEMLAKRSVPTSEGGAEVLLYGIIRMGFHAGIDSTNIFMTGYIVFYFIAIIMLLAMMALKFGLSARDKTNKARSRDIFGPQHDWQSFMRGNICRITLLGYPQFCVFSMWELYRRDSAAEAVLAITIWLAMTIILGNGIFKIFQHARSSRHFNKTPNSSLYFDEACLTKWGSLYVYYKAEAYYFIIPLIVYSVLKGMIIAFAQHNPTAQAIVLLIFEAAFLVCTAILRPYRDKKANGFAITAAAINFVNAIFILVFSDIFNPPDLMTGIMAVIFFLYNAVFTLILAIFMLIGLFYASRLKEPSPGWQDFCDKRASAQSMTQLIETEDRRITELLPLQEAARTDELLKSPRPLSPSASSVNSSSRPYGDMNNKMAFDSRWDLDHGHDGSIYNFRHSAAPPSPFEGPIEPTLPLIPCSSNMSGRRV